jgi:serine/threonine protein kinase
MSQQGTRIGPYALQVQVGRAAGCTVWHAQRADGKTRGPSKVAVRLLDDPADSQAQTRLELEYQRLKALDGAGAPQAVALYAGFGALVMELKHGATLRALLDASMAATLELDTATALEIALGTARVLRHAHQISSSLSHARLAPADILLGRDGSVTLMGWGGWSPQVWSPGIAPELHRGQAPSPQADQYALGAVLLSTLEPQLAHQQGLQAALHRVARNSPATGRLVETLLCADPGGRFPDLGPVIHELLALTRQEGGVARIGELAERCATFRRGAAQARSLGLTLPPVAPVTPAPLPPIVPPPVVPPPKVSPRPAPAPRPTPAPTPAPAPAPEPTTAAIPQPVAPKPEPKPAPAPEPTPEPTPAPEPEPEPEVEKTELIEPTLGDQPGGLDEAEEYTETDDGASMQLMERVALALVGLLGLAVLAWLGRSCLGG